MCGGLALAAGDRAFSWNAGRLFTYAVLGAIAGQLGRFVPGPAWLPKVLSGVLLVIFAARLAGFLELPHLKLPRFVQSFAKRGGFFFGLATGLLPCGLTWTALALPVAGDGPLQGALVMLAFGVGTLPALAAVGSLRRLTADRPWLRIAMAALVLVAGATSIWIRQPATPSCH
jgi:sulfite exporter TauE/SafE